MKWSNVPFRVESRLVRLYYRWTRQRPSSAPYLSGDGFRTLAPFHYEGPGNCNFTFSQVTSGALVFCPTWALDQFMAEIGSRIPVPFSILCHNDDTSLTAEQVSALPAHVKAVFTQNALVVDPVVVPVPIGLENKCLHYNGVTADFDRLRRRARPEKNRILYAFSVQTNPAVRGPALEALAAHPLADLLERVNSRAYRKVAARYRFIASPPGNGVDCHRTWEALYLRAVPIVVRSSLTEHFEALGLPLWLVDSYEELHGLTEADLEARYQSFSGRFDHQALWMEYWTSVLGLNGHAKP